MSHNVKCLACGTINRILNHQTELVSKCRTCGGIFEQPGIAKLVDFVHKHRAKNLLVFTMFAIGLWRFLGFTERLVTATAPITATPITLPIAENILPPSPPVTSVTSTNAEAPITDCSVFPQPRQGIYRYYSSAPRIASLTLRTASGSNYFVKLEDAASGTWVMSLFVYGGTTYSVHVPLGSFTLKYATGNY